MEEGGSEGKGVGAYIHSDLMDCKNDTTEHHHRDGTFNRLHLFIYLFIYFLVYWQDKHQRTRKQWIINWTARVKERSRCNLR